MNFVLVLVLIVVVYAHLLLQLAHPFLFCPHFGFFDGSFMLVFFAFQHFQVSLQVFDVGHGIGVQRICRDYFSVDGPGHSSHLEQIQIQSRNEPERYETEM